jgi:hypothetical protein
MRRVYGNPEVFSLNIFSSRGIQYPELPLPGTKNLLKK